MFSHTGVYRYCPRAPQSASSLEGARNYSSATCVIREINIWEDSPNDLFVRGSGSAVQKETVAPKVESFACHYDGSVWTRFPNESSYYYADADVRIVAVWGEAGEIYILYVDESAEAELNSCAVSIERFDGETSMLSAGCDSAAEQVFEPDRILRIGFFPAQATAFFAPVKGGAIYYNGTRWRTIPFEGNWDRLYAQYPFVVFSKTNM